MALPPAGYGTGSSFCSQHGGTLFSASMQFDNIYACDSYSGGKAPAGQTPFDENGDESFQCVELSGRFLWSLYGRWAGPGSDDGDLNGYNFVSWVGKSYHLPCGKPSPSNIPVAGDIVSFAPGNGYDAGVGHTAVVIGSNPSKDEFKILSENWTGSEPGIEILKVGSGSNAGMTQYSTDGGQYFDGEWDSTEFLEMHGASNFYIATQSTPTSPPNATVGKPYSFTFTTIGANSKLPTTWSLAGGALPTGLSLSSGGVISGTAPAQDKPANFTVKVVNGTKSAEATFTIWALNAPTPPLTITTPSSLDSPPNAEVAEPYEFQLLASGGTGTDTWSLVKGSLPTGLSLMFNGLITGTAPEQSEPASFTAEVTSGSRTQKKTFILWALGTAPSKANLVRDGGFEGPVIDSGFQTYRGGNQLGPWIVTGNSVDLVNGSFLPAHGGNQEVDLSGTNYNGSSAGGLYQDIATKPGQVYTLSYAESGNNQGAPAIKNMTVTFDNLQVAATPFDTTEGNAYVVYSFTVQATSATSRLAFISNTTSLFGPLIDDVSLIASNASVGG